MTELGYFYEFLTQSLLVMEGRESARRPMERALLRSKSAASFLPNRTNVVEWLGSSAGYPGLVHTRDVGAWNRNDDDAPDPNALGRVEARVRSIDSPQAGRLEGPNGVDIFFTPARSGLRRDQDENVRVNCLLGCPLKGSGVAVGVPTRTLLTRLISGIWWLRSWPWAVAGASRRFLPRRTSSGRAGASTCISNRPGESGSTSSTYRGWMAPSHRTLTNPTGRAMR